MDSHSGVAATDLSRHWRRVYLLQIPGIDLEGLVTFEDGLWLARALPAIDEEALGLHWGEEFDAEHVAMAAVEAYIKDNRL